MCFGTFVAVFQTNECAVLSYLQTMFTIFLGTTITFTIVFPSMYFALLSSFRAAFSMSSLLASVGKVIWKRAFPLNEMVS